jgi:hypothetical protein
MKVTYPTTEDFTSEISLYSSTSNTTTVNSSESLISLFSTNNTGVELNDVLSTYTGGLSGGLSIEKQEIIKFQYRP